MPARLTSRSDTDRGTRTAFSTLRSVPFSWVPPAAAPLHCRPHVRRGSRRSGRSGPEVAEERERFFYLFLHVETTNEVFARAARRLVPPAVVRRRLLARARADLVREFDKHAGRARRDGRQ